MSTEGVIDLTQEEVRNTYRLVKQYLKKREEKIYTTDIDKLTSTDKLLAIIYSKLVRKKAEQLEPEITNDLLSIESDIGILKGLEHRVKPFSSILEKTVADSVDYNGSYKRASSNINDSIRYTFVINDNDYVEKVDSCLHTLEDMGYTIIALKNKWNSIEFKGINVRLVAKNNNDIFEIQFHTPLAYRIKEGEDKESRENSTRMLYQVSRDKAAPKWLRLKADKLRIYLQTFIEVPEGAIEYMYDPEIKLGRKK